MNGKLIDQLIRDKYLQTPRIIEAFRKVERADFVPRELIKIYGRQYINEHNAPIQIGFEQTISQPLTVAFMLELLAPRAGDRILDVGSGSGWQTALLCEIVGPKGFVYAIERIAELKEFGEKNASKYKYQNAQFICGDGSEGLPFEAPFDRIIAAASAQEIPVAWKKQLKVGGRLVFPLKESIWRLAKKDEEAFEEKEYPGFLFVPLITGK